MTGKFEKARQLLREFKGGDYVFGLDCFDRLGGLVAASSGQRRGPDRAQLGKRAAVVAGGVGKDWGRTIHEKTRASLAAAGVDVLGEFIPGAKPNAPREDVSRIARELRDRRPEVVVVVGAGSTIDATKAASAMAVLGEKHSDVDEYFGVGKVTEMLTAEGAGMPPLVAAELASSSAAHLTKYSNVTDLATGQKKLIVDEAVVPPGALFDYSMTVTMSKDFTSDGALDGVAHALEVFYGLKGEALERVRPVSTLAIDLVVRNIKRACDAPDDLAAREALGLGTDLGGYAIMIGGTNGAHLTSFSLVDLLPHGRACALMNPYYTVFFAPAIEDQLRAVGAIFAEAGYLKADTSALGGRDLGLAVAEAMLALSRDIGFPTELREVEGFSDEHITRALAAAKNPQLEMKLTNMPVPLSAETVDDYMGPVLEAAKRGDFSLIRNMADRGP